MENWENGKFEQEWSKALSGAEGDVPTSVWNSIDASLSHAEGSAMRKRVIFYQRLAAASLIFAALAGASSLYFSGVLISPSETPAITLSTPAAEDKTNPSSTNKNEFEQSSTAQNLESNSSINQKSNESSSGKIIASQSNESTKRFGEDYSSTTSGNVQSIAVLVKEEEAMAMKIEDATVSYFNRTVAYHLSLDVVIPEPEANVKGSPREATLWRRLPAFPASYMNDSKKKKQSTENLWASVGASAGSFNPNINNSGVAAVALPSSGFSSTGYSESANQGTAYSVGMSMGTRVAKRWVVQGGLNYLNQSTAYQSNLVSAEANNRFKAAVADYASLQSGTLQLTTPYEANSINEILSVPVQAGYLLVDRKVGVQFNTGVATDVFIRNSIVDQSGQLDKFSESAGASSPYRTISWSGLLGSEVSYKIADQYRISLVPGLRYSFNSVLKSQSGSISYPIMMDVGFRFRYIFK